jgi:hypothetical protein
MLSAVSEDLNVAVNNVGETAVSVGINDPDVDMTFMLADLSVIRSVPALKNMPDWNVKINIDDEFRNKFIKAKNAIPESENFAVRSTNGKVDVIINYSSINTNRIQFSIDSPDSADTPVICFSSTLFKEILVSNKDAGSGVLEVSPAGLARVTFTSKNYKSTYYLVQLQTT